MDFDSHLSIKVMMIFFFKVLTTLTRHLPIKLVSGDDPFRLFVKIACACIYIVHSNLRSPISLYDAMKAIQWQPSQLK